VTSKLVSPSILFAVAGILLLAPGTANAFRTAADQPQFAGTSRVRFKEDAISYVLNLPMPNMTQDEVAQIAARALHKWSEPSCSRLVFGFSEQSSSMAVPGDGINTIQFVATGWQSRGYDPTAPGITDVQYEKDAAGQWVIVEADTYINGENFTWIASGTPTDGSRDLESVLTHESGHMLGLLHPCEIAGANGAPDCASDPTFSTRTMYPIYSESEANLSSDDVAGVCFLYPGVSCEVSGCPFGTVCRPEGCLEKCGDGVCTSGEFCTPDGCWPKDKCWGPNCKLSCEQDGDCASGRSCVGKRCTGGAPPGDPCASSLECASAICTTAGVCVNSCSHCIEGACPAADGGDRVACTTSKLPLGAPCTSPDECLGGQCLAGADSTPVCSRLCDDKAACPSSWGCVAVEDKNVCRPMKFAPTGGCSISLAKASPCRGASTYLLLLGLGIVLARRRAQSPATNAIVMTRSS